MAIKTLRYTITTDGLTPAFERSGGTQSDHKVTALQFELSNTLYESLLGQIGDGRAVYRFDCYDGEGALHSGETNELLSAQLKPYELEYWVTKFGGKLTVCVIISIINSENTMLEFLNCEAKLNLKNLPDAIFEDDEYKSMSTLADTVKEKSEAANAAMEEAVAALNEIRSIKLALENAEWVFDSNEPNSEIDIEFVIDGELDETSNNALANRVITEKFGAVDNKFEILNESMAWRSLDDLIDAIKEEIFLEAHPVGSYYWSSEPTSPAVLFGGNWKQITDVFLLAASNDYAAGSSGGEREHVLTVSEMPSHSHMFNPSANADGINFVAPTKTIGTGGSAISLWGTASYPGHWANDTWGTYAVGGSKAHNNMPPYIAAYCWQRIQEDEEE